MFTVLSDKKSVRLFNLFFQSRHENRSSCLPSSAALAVTNAEHNFPRQ